MSRHSKAYYLAKEEGASKEDWLSGNVEGVKPYTSISKPTQKMGEAVRTLLRAGEGHFIARAFLKDPLGDILALKIDDIAVAPVCFGDISQWASVAASRDELQGTVASWVVYKGIPTPALYVPEGEWEDVTYSTALLVKTVSDKVHSGVERAELTPLLRRRRHYMINRNGK